MAMGGNDKIDGGLGYDTLYGGDGNDISRGAAAATTLSGDAGDDRSILTAFNGRTYITDFLRRRRGDR